MKQLPNIVYFFADDMGYGDASCRNTAGKIKTPSIDRFERLDGKPSPNQSKRILSCVCLS